MGFIVREFSVVNRSAARTEAASDCKACAKPPLHAAIGKDAEFVRRNEGERMTSADAIIDGLIWEMKAPTADNLKAIERNLKRGRWQSENIIFDCRRMKKVPDAAIEREVRKQAFAIPRIKRLRYVNKHGQVIDIKG